MKQSTRSAKNGRLWQELDQLLKACGLSRGLGALGTLAVCVIQAANGLATKLLALAEKIASSALWSNSDRESDALARHTVGEVMTVEAKTVPLSLPLKHLFGLFYGHPGRAKHQGYPVVDETGRLVGMVTRSDLPEFSLSIELAWLVVEDVMSTRPPIVAFPEESLRQAAKRMLMAGIGRLPVVRPESPDKVVGILTRSDVLKALAQPAEKSERLHPGKRHGKAA
jgi:CBS domain-containing protein